MGDAAGGFLAVFGGMFLGVAFAYLFGTVIAFPAGLLVDIPLTEGFGVLVNTRRVSGSRSWRDRTAHDSHTFSIAVLAVRHL
ncbi:hypothetical protein [Amycolatopsis taiwanensis]|uniref:hypothetical protein n=1 Tax=Amycolatopsis taiwanensis TaxID=342230 RepID=UPI0012EC0A81|nr:hypothetical protein [Amycolatopsis taiwanensis]